MTASKRVALIACLTLATWVTGAPVASFAPRLLRWVGNPAIEELLFRIFILAVWLLPLLVLPPWRDIGTLRLKRTWTVFLVLPFAFVNVSGFGTIPHHGVMDVVSAICNGLLIGGFEELVFRGYAFRQSPGKHPRLVVFASALCFSLLHLLHLGDEKLGVVLFQVISAFFLGLGFGIIRLASGSLGWCVLLHGLIDATAFISRMNPEGNRGDLPMLFRGVVVVSCVVAFFVHPKLRSRSKADRVNDGLGSESSPRASQATAGTHGDLQRRPSSSQSSPGSS